MSGWFIVSENASPWVNFYKDDFSRVADAVYASAGIGPTAQALCHATHEETGRIAVGWMQSATVAAISIYNTSTGFPIPERKITFNVTSGNAIHALQFTKSGGTLLAVARGETVKWFDVATGSALTNSTATPVPAGVINHAHLAPQGTHVAFAFPASPWCQVYNIAVGGTVVQPSAALQAHTLAKFSTDGAYLALYIPNRAVNYIVLKWNGGTGYGNVTMPTQPVASQGVLTRPNCLQWTTKNGRSYLASANRDGSLWMWESDAAGTTFALITNPTVGKIDTDVHAIAFSADGAFMYTLQVYQRADHVRCYAMPASVGASYTRVWPNLPRQPALTGAIDSASGPDLVCSFNIGTTYPENKQIAVGGTDAPGIAVFRNDDFATRLTIPNSGNAPNGSRAMAMTPDGRWMAWCSTTQWLVGRIDDAGVTNLYNFGNLPTGNQSSGSVAAIALSNDAKMLAVLLNASPFIAFYDVESGVKRADPATLPPQPGGSASGMAFNNFRNRLIVCPGVGTNALVYNVSPAAISFNANLAQPAAPTAANFSDDDSRLVIGLGGSIGARTYTVTAGGTVYTQDTDGANPGGGAYVVREAQFSHDGQTMIFTMAFPAPRLFFQSYPGKVTRASQVDASIPTAARPSPSDLRVGVIGIGNAGFAEFLQAAPNTFYNKPAMSVYGGITSLNYGNYTKVATAYPPPGAPRPQICTVQ